MYADYHINEVEPIDAEELIKPVEQNNDICVLSASNNILKVGGSYKLITAKIYNSQETDITNEYSDLAVTSWRFYIDEKDITDDGLITTLSQLDKNKIKIRFVKDNSYLSKVLVVKCFATDTVVGQIEFELIAL